MSRRNRKIIVILFMIAAGASWPAWRSGWVWQTADLLERNQPGYYAIDHFIDGDTVAVRMNGHVENVRLVGIDTPETHKPDTPVQCYGPEASAYTARLIGRSKVRLASDSLSTDRDRYDRLLRYVYLPDGTLVNERLVREGYAFHYPYFPFGKSADFKNAEETARAAGSGLWSECRPEPTDGGGYVSNPAEQASE